MLRRIAGWSGAVVVATALTSGAVEVSIDMGRTFQTIDGMGAMHDIKTFKVRQGPFLVDADMTNTYDSLINVMGFTIHRRFIEGGELAPSPGVFTISDGMRRFYGTTVRRMKEFADANQEPYMVAPAILSPPSYMKYNNASTNGRVGVYTRDTTNSLIPEYYDDFGEFCARYLQTVKDSFGITCYAFSPQNEPFFNEPYSSCSYRDGGHYGRMLAEVGPRIRATGLGTLIYGCEHMGWAYPQWERQVMENAPYLDRFAIHKYTDGITVDTTTFDSTYEGSNRRLWMSETGGGTENHDSAMVMARMATRMLTRGSISAWIHVNVGNFITGDDGSRTPLLWTFAQIFRFVRPEMKRIEATCSDRDLTVAAFKDDGRGAFSVIVINSGSGEKTVRLSISGGVQADTLEKRRTTPTEKFVYDGTVEPSAAITVPAKSIVSLGCGHRNSARTVGTIARPSRGPAPVRKAEAVRVYDLRGRAVRALDAQTAGIGARSMNAAGIAQGVYCVRGLEQGSKATAVVFSPKRRPE